MSGKASERKQSSSRNAKKLRAVSMVCSLTSSWQQWVTENETKQASEPTGWAPDSLGGEKEEPRKKWATKKPPSAPTQPAAESNAETPISHGESSSKKVSTSQDPETSSRIKTKQVVKTVTSSAQEKSAGIDLLTEKIKKESLPSGEEIDRLLKKKSSPTRRRKCSNVVSSLTKSWKQVEKEKKLIKEGGGDGTDGGEEKMRLDKEEVLKQHMSKAEEEDDSEEESVRIKRAQVSL